MKKRQKPVDKIKVLYIIIGILILLLFVSIIAYFFTFIGRKIPLSLEKWSYFGTYCSFLIELSNLIIFTLLTTMAYNFQKNFSKKQIVVDNIKLITEFRSTKLSEFDILVYKLSDIIKINFNKNNKNEEIASECQILRRSFNLFFQGSEELFNNYNFTKKVYEEIECINNLFENIIKNISSLDSMNFDQILNEINNKIIELRNELWRFTYYELKKCGGISI